MLMSRTAIMSRAWVIFRRTYHYPAIPFASIGRPCFASALRRAWAEAREAKRVAAIPAEVKAARVVQIRTDLMFLEFRTDYRRASAERVALAAELSKLSS